MGAASDHNEANRVGKAWDKVSTAPFAADGLLQIQAPTWLRPWWPIYARSHQTKHQQTRNRALLGDYAMARSARALIQHLASNPDHNSSWIALLAF